MAGSQRLAMICLASFMLVIAVAAATNPEGSPIQPNIEAILVKSMTNLCVLGDNEDHVCGSDGVTYRNEMSLNCEKEKYPALTMAHMGPCQV